LLVRGHIATPRAMTIIDHESCDLSTRGGPMRTYVFRPVAPGKYPGIVVFSEIFQVTGPIRRTAALLAGNGYVVAVPEIFHEYEPAGTALSYDSAGADRGNELKTTKPLENYDADARAALDFLCAHPACTGKLGVLGICIGGHLAFRAAMNRDVRATTCFYATDIHKRGLGAGKSDDSLERAARGAIEGELLMIWGRQDPHVPFEGRRLIQETLHQAGANFQWLEFNAAHAFIRDEGPRHNPVLAQQCYAIALEMFHRRLGEGESASDQPKTGSSETRH
jgi:carboxymethylenebutenolidase